LNYSPSKEPIINNSDSDNSNNGSDFKIDSKYGKINKNKDEDENNEDILFIPHKLNQNKHKEL
jgi:hypothetical protein